MDASAPENHDPAATEHIPDDPDDPGHARRDDTDPDPSHDHHDTDTDTDNHDHHDTDNHDHHDTDTDTDTDNHDHQDHHDHDLSDLCVAVLTVSSTRTIEEDAAGDAIVEAVEAAGHEVVVRELVNDSYDGIQQTVDRLVDREDTDCVVTTGGTGVTPDDVTIEAIEPLLDKQLPGFGELFRTISFEEIGTRVVCTRATAGVTDGVGVFCLPGSENAARLGTREIVVQESPHLVGLARQGDE